MGSPSDSDSSSSEDSGSSGTTEGEAGGAVEVLALGEAMGRRRGW